MQIRFLRETQLLQILRPLLRLSGR